MATILHFRALLYCVCFLTSFVDLCSGDAIWRFNGTVKSLLPTDRTKEVQLYQKLVYYQKIYSKLYITKDGLVGFSSQVSYSPVDYSSPGLSPFLNEPFIAPYHYNGERLELVQEYTGSVNYQQFNLSSSQNLITPSVKELGDYVRSQVVGSDHFYPNWALQVTWVNVTSADEISQSSCKGSVTNPCPTNSFQLVLLSDGTDSYAIFNYGNTNIHPRKYDQAGFYGGTKSTWFGVFKNGITNEQQLTQNQGSDTPGRYIFKISSANIIRGGCSQSSDNTHLSASPTYAEMFGGKIIDISGPCFDTSINGMHNIRCRFGNGNATTPINVTATRVRCVVPHLTERGIITLALSLNGGRSYQYETPFTVVHPSQIPSTDHLMTDEGNLAWYDYRANQILLKWTPAILSAVPSAMVDISLIGYRETSNEMIYTKLEHLGSARVADGRYSFTSDSNVCSGQNCFDFELGIFEVQLQDPGQATKNQFLVSKPVPLGWYVRQAMESRHGGNWQSALCNSWHDRDKQTNSWLQDLLSCPCSLSQALVDFGRWQPDEQCSLANKDKKNNCALHEGAKHCVRSVQPVDAAGNQCCYNTAGSLMFAADTFQGSTPDRSHAWGALPYSKPGYVPLMSHGLHDVVPFFYCCLWTEFGQDCHKYMDLRPTRDCTGYTPPRAASVFGQGHVKTYTGLDFRMYGPGDFILVVAGSTVIQGRFERNPLPTEDNYNITETCALTAVSIQDKGTSDKVELRLRTPPANRETKRVDVRINGEAMSFDDEAMRWQDFTGVTVVNTDRTELIQANFTVIMSNGIGLQVGELQKSNILQLDVMIPAQSFNNVRGLFGDLSGNVMMFNGTSIDLKSASPSAQYNKFQLSWAVNMSDSLFVDFIPANDSLVLGGSTLNLNPPELSGASPQNARSICGVDVLCMYDYMRTNSRVLASTTHLATKRYTYLADSLQPVRTCGLLNVPRATKSNYNYVLGTKTTITGCRTGSLSGHESYICSATSNDTQAWSPAVTATCEVPTDTANVGMIVGIVVGVAVVVAIAIIIAAVLVRQRRKAGLKRSGEPQSEKEMETLKTNA